jgi:hypothetical protein
MFLAKVFFQVYFQDFARFFLCVTIFPVSVQLICP